MAKQQVVDIEKVLGPIMETWNAIGFDVMSAGERIRNADAVECCIDADRLTQFAYGEQGKAAAREADAEITRAIAAHGYEKVLRALARAIRLV